MSADDIGTSYIRYKSGATIALFRDCNHLCGSKIGGYEGRFLKLKYGTWKHPAEACCVCRNAGPCRYHEHVPTQAR